MMYDVVIIGGGAAGFFAAITAKKVYPDYKIALLEKSAVLLSKVKISGGGRCNVTHACFDPKVLVTHYPRGSKELLGPFHRFQPKDTIAWFEERRVPLKTEEDGRMFPVTDQSQTIISCLLEEAQELGVEIYLREKIAQIEKAESGFTIQGKEKNYLTQKLILATGNSPEGHAFAQQLGHQIQSPVPSLFTFNIPDSPIAELSGLSFNQVRIQIGDTSLSHTGALLITHFGLSGPAVLKLSAWGARHLHERGYEEKIHLNWIPHLERERAKKFLHGLKQEHPAKTLFTLNPFSFPKSFWKHFLEKSELLSERLNDISLKHLERLVDELQDDCYQIRGKTTHKEEFVTCGGVTLKEVQFKTMESKICPGLFFAGEVLDIDGVTGGFNFQSAWTTGYVAGTSCGCVATQ